MKNLTPYLLIIWLLTGCTKEFVHVFETKSPNTKESDGYYVFENDTIKITYSFWYNKGAMAFSVFNKTAKPIYIDWKNSSFIYNGNKLDYWIEDPLRVPWKGYEKYRIPENAMADAAATLPRPTPYQDPNMQSIRTERTTFIPPQSYYFHSKFYSLPEEFYTFDQSQVSKTVVPRTDNPNRETTVYEQTFDYATSPLKFRNFLAIKFSESSQEYVFYDNEFYLTSVKEMDARHFHRLFLKMDNRSKPLYTKSPFEKNTSFFIEINPFNMEFNPLK